MRAARLRRFNAVRDELTGVVFYVDMSNETCSLTAPREVTLGWAFDHSEETGRVLGQNGEWEVS